MFTINTKKMTIAMLSVFVLAVLVLAGCRKGDYTPDTPTPLLPPGITTAPTATPVPTATPIPTPTPIVDMPVDRVGTEDITRTADEESELVISGYEAWEKLNPFYSTGEREREIVDQTQLSLFDTDSEGNIVAGVDNDCFAYSIVKTESGIKLEGYPEEISVPVPVADGDGEEGEGEGEGEGTDLLSLIGTPEYETKENTFDRYTIVLKEGLTFADGTPITSDDVLFSLYKLSEKDYDGFGALGEYNIAGMRAYHTQVPESVRADAARAIAAGLTEEGTCPEDFEDKELWNAVWSNYDEAGIAFVNDIVTSVMDRFSVDAYVQTFLSTYLTAAHVQASRSLQVLFAMKMYGYVRSYNYSKNTMRDCFDVVHELDNEEMTAELFWGLIKEYYGYNLSEEDGINYERPYPEKKLEDYIAEAYCQKNLGVEEIEGVTVTTAAFGDDAERPAIEVLISSYADINDFNFYIVEKAVYESKPARTDVLTGAGKYTLVSNDENGVLLEANANYPLGVEKQKYLRYTVEEMPEEGEGEGEGEGEPTT